MNRLPYSAVVGQEDAKLALLLAAIEPRLGGVLLRGDKGSAKSTLARGLAALLPGGASFVDLPLGATEDRVVGSLDLRTALTGGEVRFSPGLLAAADGGVLYVDEINLLPDHLVDVLLDVAASGVNRVEREGVSHTHPSRFLLIGSMNPEEGDLRPQLLDRFGLAVEVRTATDVGERAAAVWRRLAFDEAPSEVGGDFEATDAALAARLAVTSPATVTAVLVESVAGLCDSVGAEGLRADLTICRAAAALAGWEGRGEASPADVRRVARFALAHRARRDPMALAGMDEQELADALDDHMGPDPSAGGAGGPPAGDGEGPEVFEAPDPSTVPPMSVGPVRRTGANAAGRHGLAPARRGRQIGDRNPDGAVTAVAVGATVRTAAGRRASDPLGAEGDGRLVEAGDLRQAIHEQRTARLVVIAVDASGSMGAAERMAAAKGAVIGLLVDAYQRRDLVALVAFRGEGAEVLLRPTGSVEVARARLSALPTGGRTPLAAGIAAGLQVATAPGRAATHRSLLVLITDGRATAGPADTDPIEAAGQAGDEVRRAGVDAVVIDVEGSAGRRLGLAGPLAARMGARHVAIEELSPAAVRAAVGMG